MELEMNEIKQLIADELEMPVTDLSEDDGWETVETWDSLVHLSILSSLDDMFDGKVSEIEEIAEAKTVREIIQLLVKNGLVS